MATPTASRYALVREALPTGKHVLCEKPLCEAWEQGRELVALAEAQPPKVQFEEPQHAQARNFLDAIACGRVDRSGGAEAVDVVPVLEAATESLRRGGAEVRLAP